MSLDLNAFLPYVNGPLGFLFRRALWIKDRRYHIARIDRNGYHVQLGPDRYRATLYCSNQHVEAAYQNLDWFMRPLHRWDMAALQPNFGFDTYSEQPDETDGVDTMIIQESPTNNYGTSIEFYIGENYGATQLCRALIKFDFSALPALQVTADGTLSLWQYADQSNNATTIYLYRQLTAWVESEVTWNIYSTGNNWTTAGGFSSSDCEQSAIGSRSFSASEGSGEKQFSLDKTLLEGMMRASFTNNGWLVKANNEVNDQYRFRSSSYTTAGERPQLEFDYKARKGGGLLL